MGLIHAIQSDGPHPQVPLPTRYPDPQCRSGFPQPFSWVCGYGCSVNAKKVYRSTSLVATVLIIRISNVQQNHAKNIDYSIAIWSTPCFTFLKKIHDSIADTISLNTNTFTICSVNTSSCSPPQADINS